MNKKMLYLITLILFNVNYLFPQGAVLDFPHTIRPNDVRGTALGLTGSAYSEGMFSIYTNPAGLSFIGKTNICYSRYPSTKYNVNDKGRYNQDNAGIGFQLFKRLFLAYNYFCLNYGEYSSYNSKKEHSFFKMYSLSASGLMIKNEKHTLSIGLNAKYYDEKIDSYQVDVYWFDFGIQYRHETAKKETFGLGISITNLGNDLKDNDYVILEPLELLRIGCSILKEQIQNSPVGLLGTVEYQKSLRDEDAPQYRWSRIGTGLEMRFFNHLFSRIGYNINLENVDNKQQGFTYGIGFITPKKLSDSIPIYIALNYSKGLKNYHSFNQNVFSIEIKLE